MNDLQFAARLGTALVLGASIGLERQWRQRTAGLRTNALVAGGASLFVTLAMLMPHESSPTRIAAQVVSGIGFLGAGVIMREGVNVRGLNTAATLWCAAAVGVLSGAGFLLQAFIGTAGVLAVHLLLRPLARKINQQPADQAEVETYYRLKLTCRSKREQHLRSLLLQMVHQGPLSLRALHEGKTEDPDRVEVCAHLLGQGRCDATLEQIVARLSPEPGVSAISWSVVQEETPDED